eukprot:4111335-Amphidinium_carterae.1
METEETARMATRPVCHLDQLSIATWRRASEAVFVEDDTKLSATSKSHITNYFHSTGIKH